MTAHEKKSPLFILIVALVWCHVAVDAFTLAGCQYYSERIWTPASVSDTVVRRTLVLNGLRDIPDFSVIEDEEEDGDISDVKFEQRIDDIAGDVDMDNEQLDVPEEPIAREEKGKVRAQNPARRREAVQENASWMQRNRAFMRQPEDESYEEFSNGRGKSDRQSNNRTFRQDFRGTRVFVQNIPLHCNWQELKDHFRMAGDVVFASVSSDPVSGQSKGHGVVQFETTEMAQHAIKTMRNFPLDGQQLYVREDVQEKNGMELGNKMPRKKGPTPPTKWKCANEENAENLLNEDEVKAIRTLIKARDDARRRRQYDAADNMRDELRFQYNVHVDDRLKMWWTAMDGNQVPRSIEEQNGPGSWDKPKDWQQIPTTPENDACVDANLVHALLTQRDIARKEKDFSTADALLEEAREAPDGHLTLRIHDPSRTWRVWTDEPPPRPVTHRKSAAEQCLEYVELHAPEKMGEIEMLLEKFPGREYNILKKLKQKYSKD